MKKVLFLVLGCMFAMVLNAQTVSADFSKIDELCNKLNTSLAKAPKATGVADVDEYIEGSKAAATGAVATADKLKNLYKREIGETTDGVTDVTETKPTLQEWMDLGTSIATQTAGMAAMADAGKKAADAVKGANKLKAASMAKSVAWSGDLLTVTGEALAEQGKAVQQIIETLKSNQNL